MLAQAGVVTGGAHGIPGHASACPMAPFAGAAIFRAVHVEPVCLARVERELGDLKSAARGRNHELTERIDSEDAFDSKRVRLAIEADSHKLGSVIGQAGFGGLGTVLDFLWRLKCDLVIRRKKWPLGQSVVGVLPAQVFFFVAVFAAWRFSVGGEYGLLIKDRGGDGRVLGDSGPLANNKNGCDRN